MRQITPPRFSWLLVNLGTAILASAVIGLFDATIEQMVALAVLMPIVASMGGNAGTQTMTVDGARAGDHASSTPTNAVRVVLREMARRAASTASSFALIIGADRRRLVRQRDSSGVVIARGNDRQHAGGRARRHPDPAALDRLGFDPAVASAVFVTTVTDVVGFFSFLGLATWWFGVPSTHAWRRQLTFT